MTQPTRTLVRLLVALFAFSAILAAASVPQVINFQGRLTDSSNNPLSATKTFTFQIFDATSGGNALPIGSPWSETQNITVTNGVFNVQVGSVTAIPYNVFRTVPIYLEITVGGETLTPRETLVTSPYAFSAQVSSNIAGGSNGAIPYQSGTDATSMLAPGTAGFVLQTNGPGAAPTWVNPGNASILLSSTNVWTAAQTFTSSVTVSTNLIVNNGGIISGNGSGITNLTAGNLTGTVGTNVLPSTIAYTNTAELWSQPQTFSSSITVNNAAQLGATGQAVTISSNLVVSGALVANNSAGTNGYLLSSQGPGATPQWVASPASTLLTSTNVWSAAQTFTSSVTVSTNLIVNNGGVMTGNGSGITNLTASNLTGIVPQAVLPSTVAYLNANQLWAAPQTYSSSITVSNAALLGAAGQAVTISSNLVMSGALVANNGAGTSGYILQSQGPGNPPTWITSPASSLLTTTNTWTAGQTFVSSVTVSTNLIVNNGGVITGNGSGLTNVPVTALTGSDLPGGSTSYIQVSPNALQPSSTFYVSSGTVNSLTVGNSIGLPTKSVALAALADGTLQSTVVASSITPNSVYPAALQSAVYGSITGIGTQTGALNMNSHQINNLLTPTGANDAATKGYVDAATNSVNTSVLLTTTNTWTAGQTFVSSITISTNILVNNGGVITGNGSGITNLVAGQLTGTVGTNVLPSTVAYTNIENNWSHEQTFGSSITVNSAAALGSAANAVMISSNLVVSGAIVANGSAGTNGFILQSQGPGLPPTWITSPASSLLTTTNTWTANQMFASSIAVTAPLGMGVTYGLNVGSMTGAGLSNCANDGSHALIWSNVTNQFSCQSITGSGAAGLLTSSNTWSGTNTFASSVTVTAPLGESVTYGLNVGSMTGAGLANCANDGSHALIWSNVTNQFSCQSITGSGAAGLLTSTNVWSGANTFTSSVTVSSNLIVNNGGVITGNGSGITNLTAGNLTGTVGTNVLPSTVAYTNIENNWSHAQTFGSSITVNNAAALGSAANAVTVSSNLVVNYALVGANGAGTSGFLLASQGPNTAPQWVASPASTLLTSTNVWSAAQTFTSSVTVSTNLIVNNGGIITGNGSGITSLTAGNLTGTVGTNVLPSTVAYTNIENNWSHAQTFGSSITVNNAASLGATAQGVTISSNLVVSGAIVANGSAGTNGFILQSQGPGLSPTWITSPASSLLTTTNTWTAGQTFVSSVTVSTNLIVNNGGVITGNGSGITNLTAGNLTGTVGTNVLPSTVAYTNIENNWSHAQTFGSSITVNNAAALGSAANAVTVSSNLVVNYALVGANGAGISGYLLSSQGPNTAPQWVASPASTLLTSTNVWSAAQTYTSSVTVSTNLIVNNGGVITGNGLGITNLTAGNLTGTVGTNVLPSTVAYLNANQLWTAPQTYSSSITVNNAALLGAANQAVTISSNLIVNGGALSVANGAGTSGYLLSSQGVGSAPTWVASPASTLLTSTNVWSAAQTFTSSVTVSTNLIVNNGGVITGNGSGITNLTAGNLTGTVGTNVLPSTVAYTNIENNWSHAQTFGSSITVNNAAALGSAANAVTVSSNLVVNYALVGSNGAGTSGYLLSSQGPNTAPQWVASPASTLLTSTNVWSAAQAYTSSVTVSTNLIVNNGGVITGNGSGITNLTAGNLTGTVGTNVLPSTVAYLNANQLWTAPQTYSSSVTVNNAALLGAAGQAVTISSNLVVAGGALSVSNGAGTSGFLLASQGQGSAPQWVASPASTLLNSTNTWTGGNTYLSSSTFNGTVLISTNLIVNNGQILAPNGGSGAPSYSFSSSTPDGMYLVSAGQVRINGGNHFVTITNGQGVGIDGDMLAFYGSGFQFGVANDVLSWNPGGGVDTGLSRIAAAKLGIGNGTSGDTSGTLIAGNIGIGTASPATKLHLSSGTLTIDGNTGGINNKAPGGETVTYGLNVGSMTGAGLANCANDGSHALIWSNVTNQFSCQSITGSGAAGLLTSSNTWSGTNTYASSVTITAPLGAGVTYGLSVGSITVGSAITLPANSVAANAIAGGTNNNAFTLGGTLTLGGAGNAVTVSSNVTLGAAGTLTNVPALTASQFVKTDASKNLTSGTIGAGDLNGAAILNQNSLQAGATAYPAYLYAGSSASIQGPLAVSGLITAGSGNNVITTAAGLLDATKLTNTVPNAALSGTYGNALTFGGAGNAVTISSNATLGAAGTLTNVPALGASQFVKTDASKNLVSATIGAGDLNGAAILNQNSLQAGATAYPAYVYAGSSESVLGPLAVSGLITAGSGNNVITTAAGLLDATKLTNTVPNAALSGTYGNALTFGGAGNAVTVSSNLVVGAAGTLITMNPLTASQFVKTDASKNLISGTIGASDLNGSAILNQNSLQAGATAYPAYLYVGSSESVLGPLAVSGQITAGTGNNVITTAAGLLDATKLTNTVPNASLSGTYGNALTFGGAGNAVTVSSNVTLGAAGTLTNVPALTASQFVKTDASKNLVSATIGAGDLNGAAILNQNSLQAGATAYPAYVYAGSSESVLGPLAVSGLITAGSGNNVITTAAGLLDATKLTNTVPSASITGTYSNNLTLSGALTLGGAGNAVTISSNATLGAAGTLTNVPALTASQFVKTDASKNLISGTLGAADMSALLASSNTWTAQQTFNNQITVATDVVINSGKLNLTDTNANDSFSLRVGSSTSAYNLVVTTGGNVGVGTSAPGNVFQVAGSGTGNDSVFGVSDGAYGTMISASVLSGVPRVSMLGNMTVQTAGGTNFLLVENAGGGNLLESLNFGGLSLMPLLLQGSTVLLQPNSGSGVGIGTSSPATLLHMSSGTFTVDGGSGTINVTGGGGIIATYGITAGTLTLTANAPLSINGSVGSSGQILQSAGAGAAPTWVSASNSSLLSSTNTWTAQQTYNKTVIISTTIGLGGLGTTGTSGQFMTSQGTSTTPSWTSVNAAAYTWSQPQTFSSSITVNNAALLGAPNQAVTISSNLVVAGGALSVGNGAGTSGYLLSSLGAGSAPTWVASPASTLLTTTNTWTAQQTYNNTVIISTTIGLGGLGTTGSVGNTLQSAGAAGTPTWGALNLGGGANYVSGTLAAAQFPALTGDITTSAGSLAATAAALQNSITTFGSSITINGASGLNVKYGASLGSATVNNLTASQFVKTDASKNLISGTLGAADMSALLASSNTWTAAQTFTSSVTVSTNMAVNNGTITMTNSSIAISSGVLGSSIYNNGTNCTVNWANGNTQIISLGSNCTMNFSGGVSGRKYVLILKYTGSFTPAAWNGGTTVRFPGGVTPSFTSVNGKTDYLAFMYNDVSAAFDNLAETLNY